MNKVKLDQQQKVGNTFVDGTHKNGALFIGFHFTDS